MNTKPQFVTPNDFENYTGVNLDEILKVNSNTSNNSNLFLFRIERRLMSWVDAETFRKYSWTRLNNFQKEELQQAIIEQAEYVIRNSDLANDSGVDIDKGKIIDYDYICSIAICRPCINHLKNADLYNHVITNTYRYPDWF